MHTAGLAGVREAHPRRLVRWIGPPANCARFYAPDDADEAMRDLVRAREDAVVVGTQANYRLKAFLLRQGRRYPGREGLDAAAGG